MHTPCGHITHFWIAVSLSIRTFMSDKEWAVFMGTIEDEVTSKLKAVGREMKPSNQTPEINAIKKRLVAVRKKMRQPMTQEGEYDVLRAEEDDCRGDLAELAANADFGTWNLIHAGLKSLEGLLKARPKTDGKRAESDLEFALWKTLETRAGGKLDPKNSGQEQTNGNGLTSVGNCHKVFDALIGMYLQGHEIREWLDPQVVKWKALGKCLYDVGCFLKSQKKRSPQDCDQKLFMLWCTWEDAFPGKSFNKYHGLFCTI